MQFIIEHVWNLGWLDTHLSSCERKHQHRSQVATDLPEVIHEVCRRQVATDVHIYYTSVSPKVFSSTRCEMLHRRQEASDVHVRLSLQQFSAPRGAASCSLWQDVLVVFNLCTNEHIYGWCQFFIRTTSPQLHIPTVKLNHAISSNSCRAEIAR